MSPSTAPRPTGLRARIAAANPKPETPAKRVLPEWVRRANENRLVAKELAA